MVYDLPKPSGHHREHQVECLHIARTESKYVVELRSRRDQLIQEIAPVTVLSLYCGEHHFNAEQGNQTCT